MKIQGEKYNDKVIVPKVWEEIEVEGIKQTVLVSENVSKYIRQLEQLILPVVSKSVTVKDLKCPSCKKHCLITYIDGKECTSCGYVC